MHHKRACSLTVLALLYAAQVHGRSVEQIFRTDDANKDGQISMAEAKAGLRDEFARIDRSGDRTLDVDEIAQNIVRTATPGVTIPASVLASIADTTLRTWDVNGSGKVTYAEFQAVSLRLVFLADSDASRIISEAELRAFRREPGAARKPR